MLNKDQIKDALLEKLTSMGVELREATDEELYQALAQVVRDEVMARRSRSRGERKRQKAKKLYYLSAEFLVGRAMHNNMVSLVNEGAYMDALSELGLNKALIFESEPEPGLGNGGLGRLAACFLDSLSSLRLPAMGMTIRYEYGLFRQKIEGGYQVELPDDWLVNGNIWELPRPDQAQEVRFGGVVEEYTDEGGKLRHRMHGESTVLAVPYDMPVVGYDSDMVNMLRMWSARSKTSLDMESFSRGQYAQAMEGKALAEVISKVLYPEDNHENGRELRLKQQYFLSSASMQYIVKDFEKTYGPDWSLFPEKVVMQINDTHPGMSIPELMRIFIDEKGLGWEQAEDIARRSFAYTNHTVMDEALEKWPEELVKRLLPRIYMILHELNERVCARLWKAYTGQSDRIAHMAILAYGKVYMANLCVAMTKAVNGVSQIHADILKKRTFADYFRLEPDRFMGITNGITHRRWLMQANPALAALIDEAAGDAWRAHPERLSDLLPFADDAAFRERFARVKLDNKARLNQRLLRAQNVSFDPDAICDVQAKRMHEYKRQLMNALAILILYNRICDDERFTMPKRVYVFGAKASPGYYRAKLIIKLLNAIGELIERHPRAKTMMKLIFLENYCVSAAEDLIPAADVSEQLSTAGKEASGTGNMKFMMNGAVTIGTMDGANVEIEQAVGRENIYIFGLSAGEAESLYGHYRSSEIYETNQQVRRAMEQLIDGTLAPDTPRIFQDLYHALLFGDGGNMPDPYFVLKDLPGYLATHERMCAEYANRDAWLRKAVVNTAKSGVFSSDRTIAEYNEKIWRLSPLEL